MKVVIVAMLAALSVGCRGSQAAFLDSSASGDPVVREAEDFFHYAGQPIHPKLVEEFSGWLSDGGPVTLVVDVAHAHGSDEYSEKVETDSDGEFRYSHDAEPGERAEQFGYKRLGRLADHTVVLETWWNGGGTGYFESLMFVRFRADERLDDGKPRKRLLMEIVGTFPHGDRDDGKIEVQGDRVVVGVSRYRDKPVTLRMTAKGLAEE